MSPEDLLNLSTAELQRFAASSSLSDLQSLFDRIWERLRPLYGGQARSAESAQALAIAEAALVIATAAGNARLLIEAKHMMGRSLGANEEFEAAAPLYQEVITGLQQCGESHQAARLHLALIGVYLNAGRYPEAFAAAGHAQALFENNGDEVGLARLYHNVGNIYHRTDDHALAFEHYGKANAIFERLGDEHAIAFSSFNMANALASLDEFERSDQMYERSIQLSQRLGMTDIGLQANYNRAYLYYLRGRYSAALEIYSRLRHQYIAAGSLRHAALCDLDEAEIYLELNLSEDAAALAQRAAGTFETLVLHYEQAKALAFYGVALMQLKQFAKAVDVFAVSESIFELENNRYWSGVLDLHRAELNFTLQRYAEAAGQAERARATFSELGIRSRKALSLVLLGKAALAQDDIARAEEYTAQIADAAREGEMPFVLFPYHLLCGEIAEDKGYLAEAVRHYEAAVNELERQQARLRHDDLRVMFFKGRHRAYEALVRLALDEGDSQEALTAAYAWCERARSRALVELLSQHAPANRSALDPSLVSRITRLREELNTHYARSRPETRILTAAAEFQSISAKEQELARALREVSMFDPEYASLQQVSIATLESLRELLPSRTTLIEYFSAGDEVLAFVVSSARAGVVRGICSLETAVRLQERLRFQLEKFSLGPDFIAAHADQVLEATRQRLQDLYRGLMAPVLDGIETPHLVIVPHGSLHFVPFHAFHDGRDYMIDRFEVSYAPSAAVLKYCLEKRPVESASPLLTGVVDENAPLVAKEIAALAALFPDARVLLNEAATREGFVRAAEQSSFLHLATHAIFREDNPMFSGFKLADGWFTASDLFSVTCRTNLVTLSGCQSGVNAVAGADELLGLMRGFLYAGARSLLLSLWNVDDESTTALMTHFYRNFKNGTSKTLALRRAMTAVRERRPNPFHWAPFLLAGSW